MSSTVEERDLIARMIPKITEKMNKDFSRNGSFTPLWKHLYERRAQAERDLNYLNECLKAQEAPPRQERRSKKSKPKPTEPKFIFMNADGTECLPTYRVSKKRNRR